MSKEDRAHADKPGLSLSRFVGETIHIGDDITIHVQEVQRGRVRLKILAPQSVRILRGELVGGGGPNNAA